jgi:flagellar basal-body rod protein FlgG
MDLGLSIAAAGMGAEQVREDQLANDMANASTPGYKPTEDVQSAFGSLLLANTQTGQSIGAISTNTEITKQAPNLTPGALQQTGEPLDFAVAGAGFFAVKTTTGTAYTRNGQFTQSANGTLEDVNGNPVLSQSGAEIKVAADGTVPPSSIGVFNVTNPVDQGNNLFTGTAAGRGSGVVQGGELEASGVDAAETMIQMIASLNTFQSGQQAIQTINETMQRSASATGALSGT